MANQSGQSLPLLDEEDENVNPFLNGTPKITVLEIIKMVFMSPIALVRVVLCLLAVLFLTLIGMMATIGHLKQPEEDTEDYRPMGPCRRILMSPLRVLARAILWCMGYLWVHETGCCACFNPCAPNPSPAPVIVCNHVSIIEPLYLIYKFLPCGAGMASLAEWPLLGSVFLASTPIAIDRTTSEGRARAALQLKLRPKSSLPPTDAEREALQEKQKRLEGMPQSTGKETAAYKKLRHEVKLEKAYLDRRPMKNSFPPVLVFPEGTTTGDAYLLQFKRGAFMSGEPVQPVIVSYPYCHLDPTWSCDVSLGRTLARMFFQVYNAMAVHYLPVYVPNDAERADPQLYADNVRRTMWKAMRDSPVHPDDVIMTDHSYEDTRLLAKAQKMYKGSNPVVETTNMPFSEIRDKHSLSLEQTLKLLEQFSEADMDHDGTISKEEFAKAMELDVDDPMTSSYFNLMDPDSLGSINFRAFLQGVVVASDTMDREQKLKLVFQIYDSDRSDDVSRQEILQIIASHALATQAEQPSQLQRTRSNEELADAVMQGKESLDYNDFKAACAQHPKLMHSALDVVEQWRASISEQQMH